MTFNFNTELLVNTNLLRWITYVPSLTRLHVHVTFLEKHRHLK